MRMKRFLSAALALALTASLALPAGAAGSSFTDVADGTTAVNADILRLMGVVNGVGNDQFNPGGGLTRAEFCAMVVRFAQKESETPRYAARTIFSDVTAKHWALRYINLAAATGSIVDKVTLIAGVGDGRFEPDAPVTLAQAVTILIRLLGYQEAQTGGVWPQSYMNLAGSIGLTDKVSAGTNDPITRAQAAQLFVNALSCETGAGKLYSEGLGTSSEGVIILAVGVETDDGSSQGAIRTSANENAESYLAAAGEVKPSALVGKRGTLVCNQKGEIVTFVPDDSSAVTITLSGSAQPSYVKGTNGRQYTMSKETMLYTSGSKGGQKWMEGYSALYSGNEITMYTRKGKIVAVYAAGGAGETDTDAVVVQGTPSAAMFYQLTGGAENYAIRKNRQPIRMSDIKPYDVVTYDSMTNTLTVSDLRLTCRYEDASPNAKAPTEVKILGHTFPVLDSAWDMTKNLSLGTQITLLLTADGRVAGMTEANGKLLSTAVGMVASGGATLFLPNGGELKLTGTVTNAEDLADQLVTLSSSAKGKLSASRLAVRTAPGGFYVAGMKLGNYTVSSGVRIYERVGVAMVEIDLSGLNISSIRADDIETYRMDTSNLVDYIVLKAVTGDAYTYGKLIEGKQTGEKGGLTYENRTVTVENGSGGLGELVCGYPFRGDGFGGVVQGKNVTDGLGRAAAVTTLTEIKNVSPRDFFQSGGIDYVNAGGKTYQISTEVECYRSDSKDWFTQTTGEARLAAVKAFSSDLTVYVDPIGSKVRVIEAN